MTQCNTFIRKFGKHAIVISVTDWDDFKELDLYNKGEDGGDYLISSTITSSIYSNFLPAMLINTSTPRNISEGTRGMGIAGIMTEGCNSPLPEFDDLNGGIWAYRKCGLSIQEQFSRPSVAV